MKLKVCGITQIEQLQILDAIGIDFAGFICYEKSPRFIPFLAIQKERFQLQKVGIFVNAKEDYIMGKISDFELDIVQLHGNEPPSFCEKIKKHIPVIKAFGIAKESDMKTIKQYENVCDYFLLDTRTNNYGGSGEKFNWQILNNLDFTKPFFLSGGIAPEDTVIIKKLELNNFLALDINSKFEIRPGIKNMEKIKRFYADIKKI